MRRKTWINLVIVLGLLVSSSIMLSTERPVARAAPGEVSTADDAVVADVAAMLPLPDPRAWVDGAERGEPAAPSPANAEDVAEPAQPAGLEAMLAAGYDPLAGDKRLLSKETLLMGYNETVGADTQLHLRNYGLEDASLHEVQSTNLNNSRALYSHNVAAGDLTGDGVDEQIAAWVEADGSIYMALGAMPGLNGKTTSAPAAVAHADGRRDLLVRGYDNALWHRHYDGSAWQDWNNDGGGFLLSAPAIASRADGTFDVFVIMDDNQLYRRRWEGSGWDVDGWQLIDGQGIWPDEGWAAPVPEWPGPAAVARGGKTLHLFRLAPDNTLRWSRSGDDGEPWGAWQNLGGMLASGPGAVTSSADHMQVFAAGVDGALWHLTYSGGAWQKVDDAYDWQRIQAVGNGMPAGVSIASAPTVILPALDQITVYVRGSLDGLWQVTYDGTDWGDWLPGDSEDKSAESYDGSGGALRFDGVDDYVAVPHDDSLNPNQELTMMAWVYLEDASEDNKIVGKSRGESGYVLRVGNHGQFNPVIWDSEGTPYQLSVLADPYNTWTHLALTWKTGGDMIGYINGVKEAETPASAANAIGLTAAPLIVGAAPWDAEGWNVNGRIDEVAVFSRTLSAAEIATAHASGWDGMAGQVLGLHLDESPAKQGTTLTDASGRGNHGTLYTGETLASGIGAAAHSGGLDLFAGKADGSLLHSSDGETWASFDEPWLPACCLEEPFDTGLDTTVVTSNNRSDHMNYLDLKTGYLLGDGREQIALAYTYETGAGKRVRLQLFDVRDGFDLEPIAAETISFDDPVAPPADAYYPKLALGEFDGTPGDEIAVAYAREGGPVTVWSGDGYQGLQLSWMQGEYDNLYLYDMNDNISSIKVKDGWEACVYEDVDYGGDSWCTREDDAALRDDWNDKISSIKIKRLPTATSRPTLESAMRTAPGQVTQDSLHRNAHIALDIFDFDPQNRELASQAATFLREVPGCGHSIAPERTLNIVSGDFDGIAAFGDAKDEIAMSWDSVTDYDYTNPVDTRKNYRVWFRVLDIGMDAKDGMTIAEIQTDHFAYWFDQKPVNSGLTMQLHMAAGDLDGDGVDEIVRTWPRVIQSRDWGLLERNLEVIEVGPGLETNELELDDDTWYSDLDALAVGDLDMDLQEEIIFHSENADPGVVGGLYVYRYEPAASEPIWEMLTEFYPFSHEFYKRPVLVTGDFTGQSLRLGLPTYRVQNKVNSVTALLNMPPKHRDLVWDDAAEKVEYIAIRTEFCETRQEDPWCTHAKHGLTVDGSQETTTQTKHDWGAGAGVEIAQGGGGWTFKAAVEYNYRGMLDKLDKTITSESFDQSAIADIQDMIVYSGAPFAVWEYPLLAGETGEVFDYIILAFPMDTASPKPTPTPLDHCEEYWSDFSHQLNNVWSYDPFGTDIRFPDYDPEKVVYIPSSPYGGGAAKFEVTSRKFTETITQSLQSHAVNLRVEGGYDSGTKGKLFGLIPHGSFKIHAKGDYKRDGLSTEKTTVTDSTAVSVYFESVPLDRGFDTYPILYWARTGALVLDYQTEPGGGRIWQLYDKPDLAFILPWYGFPYPFPEPDPTGCARDPERCLRQLPPCGDDKQLFSQDVAVSPRIASVGDTVTIAATVRNFSEKSADNVVVRFYQGDPTENVVIGERTIAGSLLRSGLSGVEYPKTVSIDWVASGVGEQKIYAVIDPDDTIEEMHDEDDLIDNNVAYGLVQIGAAVNVDMGLAGEVAYQAFSYEQGGSSGRVALQEASGGAAAYQANTPVVSAYVPPGNMSEIVRFDLRDAPFNLPGVIGRAFELVAYPGSSDWEERASFDLRPVDGDPPAVIRVAYGEADIAGRDEGGLVLYWLGLSGWQPAEQTCPGYEVQRFPGDNLIAVPVCRTGLFAFSDDTPPEPDYWPEVFLPLILRNH